MTKREPTALFDPNISSPEQLEGAEDTWQGERLRKAILDSVVHDLRTPLTLIKISVTALLTTAQMDAGVRDELLTLIDEGADRLNCLVGEAVERARNDFGGRLNLEPRTIEEIIDAARRDCRMLLGARSINVQVPPGLPAARADLNLVRKALAQLLENASKYSPPEEPITVLVEMNGDFVMTSVVDRGKGIDPANGGELQSYFDSQSKDEIYAAFCVFEDSFPAFIRARQLAAASGFAYGWEPFRLQDGPVTFSAHGHRPKPQ